MISLTWYVVSCFQILSFLKLNNIPPYLCHIFPTHPSCSRHVACIHLLPNVNAAARNIGLKPSLALGFISVDMTTGSPGNSEIFLKCHQQCPKAFPMLVTFRLRVWGMRISFQFCLVRETIKAQRGKIACWNITLSLIGCRPGSKSKRWSSEVMQFSVGFYCQGHIAELIFNPTRQSLLPLFLNEKDRKKLSVLFRVIWQVNNRAGIQILISESGAWIIHLYPILNLRSIILLLSSWSFFVVSIQTLSFPNSWSKVFKLNSITFCICSLSQGSSCSNLNVTLQGFPVS